MKRKLHIVFDFDGVICKCIYPYYHFKYGEPIVEIVELIKELHNDGHTLKLSSARLYPRFNGKIDLNVISGRIKKDLKRKLKEIGILHCFSEITMFKPFGHVYIDDRGLYFNGRNHETIIEKIRKISEDNRV
jgi:phosphoglycolate phosphatase-like HAD superfamily hydrolase